MVLDIDIAMLARNLKQYGGGSRKTVPPFKRPKLSIDVSQRTTPLDQIAKHMRYTAYNRNEQHTKQVQMLLNQRRYAQNETWRSEYDRLRGTSTLDATDQARINARLDDLLKQGLQIK